MILNECGEIFCKTNQPVPEIVKERKPTQSAITGNAESTRGNTLNSIEKKAKDSSIKYAYHEETVITVRRRDVRNEQYW
jgi:hypothetical protein